MSGRREARTSAQAKLNLFLHVLERTTAGYHGLETLFARIDLADLVTVRVGVPGRSLDCHGPAAPPDGLGPTERNLAWRAAELYAEETGWPSGFAIEVVKHIPAGAGLGGGSADAAAVLRSLDRMSPRPLRGDLVAIAPLLGSDVAFLTSEAPRALAWGRGERMIALPALPSRPVHVVPGPFVHTGEAYRWLDQARGEPAAEGRSYSLDSLGSWAGVAAVAHNDFEVPVFERHPTAREARDRLSASGASPALLSGSGGAVFGVFDAADGPLPEAPPGTIISRVSDTVQGVELQP